MPTSLDAVLRSISTPAAMAGVKRRLRWMRSFAHRTTSAQAAGADSRLRGTTDIVKVIEDWEDGGEL